MNFKINGLANTYGTDAIKSSVNVAKKQTEVKRQATPSFTPSKEALEYQTTLAAVKASTDVRQDKVNELKERINSGKYSIDLNALADKMVN